MTFSGVVENVLSDFVFAFIAFVIGYLWIVISRRKQLQKFFGIKSSKRLVIYLSNIRVHRFGSIGVSDDRFSYQGSAVAYGEILGANQLRELQSFLIPSIANPQETVKNILFVDVEIQIHLSPLEEENLEKDAPIISLGAPAYNNASGYIQKMKPYSAKFRNGILVEKNENDSDNDIPSLFTTDTVTSGSTTSVGGTIDSFQNPINEKQSLYKLIPSAILIDDIPNITDTRYGFVQRLFDNKSNQYLFYVAGLSEMSTTGAALYLKSEWNSLFKKFSNDKEFLVLLRFDNSDFTQWTIVFDRELG